jgi:hypothetical protein
VPVVLANLIDFQFRFARPMDMPFEMGKDRDAYLPMPKPLPVLVKYAAFHHI